MQMEYEEDSNRRTEAIERPWIVLKTTYDVETWIDHQNRAIQQLINCGKNSGWGICFGLAAGGEIFMHTTTDGEVLLDVRPEAQWVAPLIAAATEVEMPDTQIWALPADRLTQLVFGLSTLIATTRLVVDHDFKLKKY